MLGNIFILERTGRLGKEFIKKITYQAKNFDGILVFRIDKLNHWQLKQKSSESKYPLLRFFLRNKKDKNLLKSFFKAISEVLCSAAINKFQQNIIQWNL